MKDHCLVQTRISKADAKALNDAAHREGISVAALARRMIVGALQTGVGSDHRDFFAAHALTGIVADRNTAGFEADEIEAHALNAYALADAMLAARQPKEPTP